MWLCHSDGERALNMLNGSAVSHIFSRNIDIPVIFPVLMMFMMFPSLSQSLSLTWAVVFPLRMVDQTCSFFVT